MKRAGIMVAALVMLLTGAVAINTGTTEAQTPPSLVVDDDQQQCPNAQFTSIQAAVTAAPPGATVLVCPGTYNEVVTANKPGLRIIGSRGGGQGSSNSEGHGGGPTGLNQCRRPQPPDPQRDSIVQAPNAAGGVVNLLADNILFTGFVVQNNNLGTGIYSAPTFSGYDIERNIVQNNVFGIYFHSSGAMPSVVERNCLRSNNTPGAANGNGLYSDQGLRDARIERNDSFDNMNAGYLLAQNAMNVTLERNTSLQDGSGIVVFQDNSGVSLLQNDIDNTTFGSAIFVGPNNSNVVIDKNDIRRAMTRGIQFNSFGTTPSTNATVTKNQIRDAGAALTDDPGTPEDERELGDGIRVAPNSLTNSLIEQNHIKDSRDDGIQINTGGNAGNRIIKNQIQQSGRHDCHDATAGAGSGGSANVWDGNQGRTQNRAGLCPKAAVTPPFEHD